METLFINLVQKYDKMAGILLILFVYEYSIYKQSRIT